MHLSPKSERNAAIVAARDAGETLESIGKRFEISRERVRQVWLRAQPDYVSGHRGGGRPRLPPDAVSTLREMWHEENAEGQPLLTVAEIAVVVSRRVLWVFDLAHRSGWRRRYGDRWAKSRAERNAHVREEFKGPVSVTYDNQGGIDEVLGRFCQIHLERISDTHFCLEVRKGKQVVTLDFASEGGLVPRVEDVTEKE